MYCLLGLAEAHWEPTEEPPTWVRHWARTTPRDAADAGKHAGNWCQVAVAAQGLHAVYI